MMRFAIDPCGTSDPKRLEPESQNEVTPGMNMTKLMLIAAVLAAGCSKKTDKSGGGGGGAAAACKPLAVTVDGTPLAAMPNGLAKSNNMSGDLSYEVHVFDHDKTTCEDMLSKSGRTVPEGEVSVRAWAGGAGSMGKGVGLSAHAQMDVDVKLVSDKPKAAGDVVKLCVNNVSFTPQIGAEKGKTVVMDGLVEGKYCGEMKW
jgi:hypothetical protein